jgi:hypothetical protein
MHLLPIQFLVRSFFIYIICMYRIFCGTGAVPKKILEMMNEDGLSREQVASHLQVLVPLSSLIAHFVSTGDYWLTLFLVQ